jgi:hypothetical protein
MPTAAAKKRFDSLPEHYRDFDGNFWEKYWDGYCLVPPAWQEKVAHILDARNLFRMRVFHGHIDLTVAEIDTPLDVPHYYLARNPRGSVTHYLIGTAPEQAEIAPALPDNYLDLAGRVWGLRGPDSDLYYAEITAGKAFDRIKAAGEAIANFAMRHCRISSTGKIVQEIAV